MGTFMTQNLKLAINDLFHAGSLDETQNLNIQSWSLPSQFLTLPIFIMFKFVFCATAITLAIPCGMVTPVFTIGAGIGRLYGEIASLVDPDIVPGDNCKKKKKRL